jgi:hypothetical protein
MAKPKYASLNGGMIRRGFVLRPIRIVNPDGGFVVSNIVVEEEFADDRRCAACGSPLP